MIKKITCKILYLLLILSALAITVLPAYAENESVTETTSDLAILEVLTCTDGSMSLSVGKHQYNQNIDEVIRLIPNIGYSIYGVEINGVFQELDSDTVTVPVVVGKTITVRPVFRGNVVFNIEQSAGGKISPEGTVYVGTGKYLDVIATPDSGYICTGIYINDVGLDVVKEGNSYKGSFKAPREKEYTVYATFEPVTTHTVNLIKNEGGRVIPFDEEGKAYVFSGENAQFQVIPDEGYGIKNITVSGKAVQWSADGIFTLENVNSDFEIVVEFVQMESIPVSITITGKGFITPAEKAYANTTLVLDIKPDEGYELVSLTVNEIPTAQSKDGKLEIIVTEEIIATGKLEIKALFDVVAKKHIIRAIVQNSIGGTITAEGYIIESMRTEVRDGGSITFTFTPDMNYIIDKVKVDGIEVTLSEENKFTLSNVTDTHRIIAYFVPDLAGGEDFFKITVNAGKGGSVEPSSEQLVKPGQSITFTFIPDKNYQVDYILVDGEKQTVEDNKYTIENVIANRSLEVFFKEKESVDIENGIVWGGEEVTVDISKDPIVNSDISKQLNDKAKDKKVTFKGNNYIWSIPAGFSYPETDIDFSVSIGKSFAPDELLTSLEEKMIKSKIQGFAFEIVKTSGIILPENTFLTVNIGTEFSGKTLDYLFYNPETGKFKSVIDTINESEKKYDSRVVKADEDGKVVIPYNGNEYLILVVSATSKFNITINVGEHGSVSPRGTSSVLINTNQTILITPDPGYKVSEIIVNGASMYQEFIGKTDSFAISLGKINNDYTIEISFEPSGEVNSSDDDVGDISSNGGLKPWAVALIIIGIAIVGGIILFIYKWNAEKDIVD